MSGPEKTVFHVHFDRRSAGGFNVAAYADPPDPALGPHQNVFRLVGVSFDEAWKEARKWVSERMTYDE